MNRRQVLLLCIGLVTLAGLLIGACAPGQSATQQTETEQPAQETTLRLALLPILDALPIHVALKEGYFADEGVDVELIPVSSAAERDQIMAAGQADGMINDLVSTLLYNQEIPQIQIVSFARTATPEFPQYRILAAGDSGITSVDDLKNVEIGISEASVIEYTTDRLLEAEGLTQDEITTVAVPKIPDRLSLLESGELKAANLPDPFSSLAIQNGAVVIVDDTKHPEYGNSVISFRTPVIEANPKTIRSFLRALDKAIEAVNDDPMKYQDLLVEQKLIPAPLIGSYEIPPFVWGKVPSQAQWEDVLAWAQEKGLVSNDVSYDESVTYSFLP
jgi:NitT/TauT family transport system substrate-binding protein